MAHLQPPTPIQTNNSCAAGIANGTVKQRRSKAIDMRFYWVCDRVWQKHFLVHWQRGSDNLVDFFTKHHSTTHHPLMRSRYLIDLHKPQAINQSDEGVLIPQRDPQSLPNPHIPTHGTPACVAPHTSRARSNGARSNQLHTHTKT
jgi:hypothetical protein